VASPALLLIGSAWLIAWTAAPPVGGIWLVTIGVVSFSTGATSPAALRQALRPKRANEADPPRNALSSSRHDIRLIT
jgi:hypothetical protein